MITRTAVESSNLASVGYAPIPRLLEVEFKNGSVYRYSDVPPEVFDGLMEAESKGSYFDAHVKKAGFRFFKLATVEEQYEEILRLVAHLNEKMEAKKLPPDYRLTLTLNRALFDWLNEHHSADEWRQTQRVRVEVNDDLLAGFNDSHVFTHPEGGPA